jgi:hypothetical protein
LEIVVLLSSIGVMPFTLPSLIEIASSDDKLCLKMRSLWQKTIKLNWKHRPSRDPSHLDAVPEVCQVSGEVGVVPRRQRPADGWSHPAFRRCDASMMQQNNCY